MQLLGSDLPSIKKEKEAKFTDYQEPTGSPFRQTKRMFRLSDYTNINYEEKEIDVNRDQQMFRRTRFKINERTNSRSRSRSNSAKLDPLKHSEK